MPDLPVMLNVAGKPCVVVGGGEVACRRAESLLEAGGQVTVIAPRIDPPLYAMAVTCVQRPYEPGDLRGAFLAVIATDDPAVNLAAAAECRQHHVLVNRADNPGQGDLTVPAHARHGPVTLAVHTAGISASAAAAIRRELSKALDPAWPELLEVVAPFREMIQQRIADRQLRTRRLTQLTDEQARSIFRDQGPDALREYAKGLTEVERK